MVDMKMRFCRMVDMNMRVILFVMGAAFLHVDVAGFECDVKMTAVGCFKDVVGNRALPEQLLNERDKTSNVYGGRSIDWKDPYYLPGFICRCARIAKRRGYMYIGIQFFGECWSGQNSRWLHKKHGVAKNCGKNWYKTPTCDVRSGKQETNYVYKILDRHCETDFSPIGCFHDNQKKPRPLPYYALNERDPSHKNWNGKTIAWKNWNTYLPHFICRCARIAMDRGDDFFGIQFYGECWSGKKGQSDYSRDGASNKCIGQDWKPCNCTAYHCSGEEATNFVYELNRKTVRDIEPYRKIDYFRDALLYRPRYRHYYDYPKYESYRREYEDEDDGDGYESEFEE